MTELKPDFLSVYFDNDSTVVDFLKVVGNDSSLFSVPFSAMQLDGMQEYEIHNIAIEICTRAKKEGVGLVIQTLFQRRELLFLILWRKIETSPSI